MHQHFYFGAFTVGQNAPNRNQISAGFSRLTSTFFSSSPASSLHHVYEEYIAWNNSPRHTYVHAEVLAEHTVDVHSSSSRHHTAPYS